MVQLNKLNVCQCSAIGYTLQMLMIFTVIVTCLVNLSLSSEHSTLWVAFLSSCLGYILPQPKLKRIKNNNNINDSSSET